MPILLPLEKTQNRVLEIVDAIDADIAALDAEAVSLGVMLSALRRRLGASPSKVLLASLADISGIQIGPFGSQLHAAEYTATGVGVVMPQDLIEGAIATKKLKRVAPETAARLSKHRLVRGDVVFPRRGDLSKRALVTPAEEGWLCGTGCIRFRAVPDVDSSYVFEALSNPWITEWLVDHAVGTTMLNLNTTILENVPLPAPSAEMVDLARACTAVAAARLAVMAERGSLLNARAAALPALLSGDLEIPESYDELVGAT